MHILLSSVGEAILQILKSLPASLLFKWTDTFTDYFKQPFSSRLCDKRHLEKMLALFRRLCNVKPWVKIHWNFVSITDFSNANQNRCNGVLQCQGFFKYLAIYYLYLATHWYQSDIDIFAEENTCFQTDFYEHKKFSNVLEINTT